MLRFLVARASSALDRVAPAPPGITILLYHRIGGGSSQPVDLTVAEFRDQLAVLVASRRVLTLDEAAAELASGVGPTDGVVLTFDDGTADFTDHAVPALVDAGLPATLFVASGFVEHGRPFPKGARPTSWPALRDAAATGLVTMGSHTHDHVVLQRLTAADARTELTRSVETIAERMGERPVHFAYPKAVPSPAHVEREVRTMFETAALAGNRVNTGLRPDLHRLSRSPVKRGLGPDSFASLARGGGRLEGGLRAAVAPVRYRTSAY